MLHLEYNTLFYALLALWAPVIVVAFLRSDKLHKYAVTAGVLGVCLLSVYLADLWVALGRPPLRTLGETRLWYVLLLALAGISIYFYHRLFWFFSYSVGMALVFLFFNFMHPEVFDKSLMPALQSKWFIPHVVVYIEAYALLAAATLVAFRALIRGELNSGVREIQIADGLVRLGYGFLTMGLIFGAWWAKEAWGHYWTWDPKETWALITWLCYLVYIHLRHLYPKRSDIAYLFLLASFIVLLMAWFGVNYLPTAKLSVHAYGA